jgi:hypothetical protein
VIYLYTSAATVDLIGFTLGSIHGSGSIPYLK